MASGLLFRPTRCSSVIASLLEAFVAEDTPASKASVLLLFAED